MGRSPFASETVKTFAVMDSHLMDTGNLPNSIAAAVLAAVNREEDIITHLLNASKLTYSLAAEDYYNYGKKYYFGYTEVSDTIPNSKEAELLEIYENIEQESIINLSYSYGYLNADTYGFVYLQETYNWKNVDDVIDFSGSLYEHYGNEYTPTVYESEQLPGQPIAVLENFEHI